jgi:hypothetical protein
LRNPFTSFLAQGLFCRLEFVGTACRDRDSGAHLAECRSHVEAQAARTAGNQRDPTGQVE